MLAKLYALLFLSAVFNISTEIDETKLVGKWTYDVMLEGDVRMVGFTVYHKDQTFYGEAEFTHEDEKLDSMRIRGTWSLDGSSFITTATFIDNPEMDDLTLEARMLELNEEYLRYEAPDGTIYKEYRSK